MSLVQFTWSYPQLVPTQLSLNMLISCPIFQRIATHPFDPHYSYTHFMDVMFFNFSQYSIKHGWYYICPIELPFLLQWYVTIRALQKQSYISNIFFLFKPKVLIIFTCVVWMVIKNDQVSIFVLVTKRYNVYHNVSSGLELYSCWNSVNVVKIKRFSKNFCSRFVIAHLLPIGSYMPMSEVPFSTKQ